MPAALLPYSLQAYAEEKGVELDKGPGQGSS